MIKPSCSEYKFKIANQKSFVRTNNLKISFNTNILLYVVFKYKICAFYGCFCCMFFCKKSPFIYKLTPISPAAALKKIPKILDLCIEMYSILKPPSCQLKSILEAEYLQFQRGPESEFAKKFQQSVSNNFQDINFLEDS